jgi:hypothetical protein
MDLQSLWQVLQPYLAGRIRHFLCLAAGCLVARGVILPDQQSAFVTIGVTIAGYLGAEIWSVMAANAAKAVPWLWAEKARLEKLLAIYQKQATGQKQ